MAKTRQNAKKKLTPLTLLAILAALALLLSALTYTMARYFLASDSSTAAVAEPFYFASDRLSDEAPEPYYQIEAQETDAISIPFELRNFVDSLRVTDEEFRVDYQAEDVLGAEIPGTSGSVTFTGGGGAQTHDVVLEIDSSLFAEGSTVRISATSMGRYERRLTAAYGFTTIQNTITYTVEDVGNMVVLYLGGGSTGQVATIAWQDGLIPDTSDAVFSNAAGSTATVAVESGRIYTFTFYKKNVSDKYTKSNFTVLLE